MRIPFSPEQFFEVMKDYNLSVYPMQIVLNLLALAAIFLVVRKSAVADRFVSIVVSFFWLWMGIAYHLLYFAAINPAAYVFGAAFVLQGFLTFYVGFAKSRLSFGFRSDIHGVTGGILIFYALLLYPVLGYLLGRIYPSSPTFGLPCPTTIFTFGIYLWTMNRFPKVLLIIPSLWAVVGVSAALSLGVAEDLGLIVAAILTGTMILVRNK